MEENKPICDADGNQIPSYTESNQNKKNQNPKKPIKQAGQGRKLYKTSGIEPSY